MIVICLTPHSLGLGLNAALGAQHRHRAVQHTQGTLHLNGEVNVARCVDDVDTVGLELLVGAGPEAGGGSGGDGDTTLLLLHHPVHGGRTLMGLADLMVDTGVVQNPLSSRRFTGINVSHDANISGFFQSNFSGHWLCSLFS